jgi:hypothetical protein
MGLKGLDAKTNWLAIGGWVHGELQLWVVRSEKLVAEARDSLGTQRIRGTSAIGSHKQWLVKAENTLCVL